nr:hypothetical protein [uncultured Mediterranean phage uvMED]
MTVYNPGTGNKFYLDSTHQSIHLLRGQKYVFDQSDSTNNNHPLRFSTTQNGTHGGGSQYTSGVTASGTPGQSGAKVEFIVPEDAPNTLYYYCTNHSGMAGNTTITVSTLLGSSLQGETGAQGQMGSQGTSGSQGATGTQGADGAQGTQGLDASAVASQGAAGPQGSDGSQGTQGETGAQGTDASGSAAQGTQGITGSQGTQGPNGPERVLGVKYDFNTGSTNQSAVSGTGKIHFDRTTVPAGNITMYVVLSSTDNQGSSVTNAFISGSILSIHTPQGEFRFYVTITQSLTGGLRHGCRYVGGPRTQGQTWNISNNTEVGYNVITGSQGLDGTQGATGAQGTQGTDASDIASQGTQGETGAQGTTGTQGTQGELGLQGSTGVGLQGVTGTQGIQGFPGAGSQGAAGTNGSQGAQGTIGPSGGVQGAQGTAGVVGGVSAGLAIALAAAL